ncbi:hypothetical protein [Clostridium perfringens]|nr:hypothetical protein [Clostridium perfringens]
MRLKLKELSVLNDLSKFSIYKNKVRKFSVFYKELEVKSGLYK